MNSCVAAQFKTMFIVAIVNSVKVIWNAQNQVRFQNNFNLWKSSQYTIISQISLAGNRCTASAGSYMRKFMVLKNFSFQIHPPKTKILKQVLWCPPMVVSIKVNIDGAFGGSPLKAACGGMF